MADFEISWEAPEYEYHEKGVSWYWLSIIIAAVFIAFAVAQKNFLFGFFVVVAEILFIIWAHRPPRILLFTINNDGVAIGEEKRHSFKELETMSVEPLGDGWAELIFVFRARFKTPLRVLVTEEHLAKFRANLKTILKEIPYEPTLLDSIEKLLRF